MEGPDRGEGVEWILSRHQIADFLEGGWGEDLSVVQVGQDEGIGGRGRLDEWR